MNQSQTVATEPLKAVVFDMDGLMFNTELLYPKVATILLERRNRRLSQDLTDNMMGKTHRDAFEVMIQFHGLTDSVDQLADESDVIFEDILDAELAPMPGLMELLDSLEQANLPKAVATSARRVMAEDLLSRYGLNSRFASILCGDEVTSGKPAPEIYLTTAEKLGLHPSQIMILEDSQTGCKAAVASGAFVVAVPGDHSRNHDFQGAAIVADTLADARIYQALCLQES
ncbi:MAG: hydrolase [Blastopirellula sp.]|nr:MAG: hydrolase [Blastopirellula sp.]